MQISLYRVISIHVDHVFCADLGELHALEEEGGDVGQPAEAAREDAEQGVEGEAEARDPPRDEDENLSWVGRTRFDNQRSAK